MVPAVPVIDPRYPATSGWGAARPATDRNHGAHTHEGLDFPAPVGTPVFALDAGTVVSSYLADTVEGEWIQIAHAWGLSRYMHLSRRMVAKGARVIPGQPIGLVGATGIRSAAHLHADVGIRESLVSTYLAKSGSGPLGKARTVGGVAYRWIPAETVIPANLTPRVVAAAEANRVKVRGGSDLLVAGLLGDLATRGGLV